MGIVVKDTGKGTFTPAPAGQYAVVCCDVADLGLQKTQFGLKDQVRIYWMLDEVMEDGRPYLITRTYTASLNEKSNLRKDLETWRGVPFKEEELKGFDLEKLIGVPAFVQIAHRTSEKGNVYANIQTLLKLPKGMQAPVIDPEYVRWQDREGNAPTEMPEEPPTPTDDDYVPEEDSDEGYGEEVPF